MTEKRAEYPPTPRTDFTFFHPVLKEALAKTGPARLAGIIILNQKLELPILFELWRNHRMKDMYALATNEGVYEMLADFPGTYGVRGIAFMYNIKRQPLPTCEAFLRETVTTIQKAQLNVPIDGALDKIAKREVEQVIAASLERVSQITRRHKAPLN